MYYVVTDSGCRFAFETWKDAYEHFNKWEWATAIIDGETGEVLWSA